MLKQIYFDHQWKSFIRSNRWRRDLINKIILSIIVLTLIFFFIELGNNIDEILFELGGDPIDTFNSFLIFYFALDLMFRFLFQSSSYIYSKPYLRFRIRRMKLINLMFIRSLGNIFNIVPWFIFVPFAVKILGKISGFKTIIPYIVAILLLVLINNFLIMLTQFLTRNRRIYYLIPISLLIFVFSIPKIESIIKIFSISFGTKIIELNLPVFSILVIGLILIVYILRKLLATSFYIAEFSNRNRLQRNLSFLDFFSFSPRIKNVGKYMLLEIKLILRNKRPRQTICIFPIFPLYLLINLLQREQNQFQILVLLSFSFGLLSLLYGQYIFSWESSFFEVIMARKFNFREYVKAKYYIMIIFSFIVFIIYVPTFILFFRQYIFSLFAMFIFTIGVTNSIILFSGVFNDGRIELNESFLFNYQGLNFNQLILPLIVLAVPFGIFYLLKVLNIIYWENIILLLTGLVLLTIHNWLIEKIILRIFKKKKYQNLEGYRKHMN